MSKLKRHASWFDNVDVVPISDSKETHLPKLKTSKSCLPVLSSISQTRKKSEKSRKPSKSKSSSLAELPCLDPQTSDDLCVSKRQKEEVSLWLDKNKHNSQVLLLTGPTGSGKTTALKVICAEKGILIKEWINQSNISLRDPQEEIECSQGEEFTRFLTQARYASLTSKSEAKDTLVLVEDMPNAFFRDPKSLHQILKKYGNSKTNCPLVFILSETPASSDLNVRRLFPSHLPNVDSVLFKSTPPTFVRKALQRIINLAPDTFSSVSKDQIQRVVEASQGDVRAAVTSLLLRSATTTSTDLCKKDETLVLFRALGKFLYSKREESGKLAFDPEEVIEKSFVEPDNFTSFLHHNYPNFFGSDSIEGLASLANNFSLADSLLQNFEAHPVIKANYIGGICGRSVAFHNSKPSVGRGLKPINRPQFRNIYWDALRQAQKLSETFAEHRLSFQTLAMDFVPFSSLIDSFNSEKQWQLAKKISKFQDQRRLEDSTTDFVPVEERPEFSQRTEVAERPTRELFVAPEDVDIDSFSSDTDDEVFL